MHHEQPQQAAGSALRDLYGSQRLQMGLVELGAIQRAGALASWRVDAGDAQRRTLSAVPALVVKEQLQEVVRKRGQEGEVGARDKGL